MTQPEQFAVGDWVVLARGQETRKVQVTDVQGKEVTVRFAGNRLTFAPQSSDGVYRRVGTTEDNVISEIIYRQAPKPEQGKRSRFKDIRDFLHGMFWGS